LKFAKVLFGQIELAEIVRDRKDIARLDLLIFVTKVIFVMRNPRKLPKILAAQKHPSKPVNVG